MSDDVPGERVAIENHLNVFHVDGAGLDPLVAAGLVAFLNSAPADRFVRLFSGHTQINAGDLRNLRYPSLEQLRQIGAATAHRVSVGDVDTAVRDVVPRLYG